MSRSLVTVCLVVCLLTQGCKVGPPPTPGDCEKPPPPTDFAAPDDETPFRRWAREHPVLMGVIAFGALAGVLFLTGYFILQDAKDGKGTPLPLPQIGP